MAVDVIEFTKQLVAIDSTTYHEYECGEFLAEFLNSEGWTVERQSVEQPDPAKTPGAGSRPRFNVYASVNNIIPDVVLSTHFDTVPPFLGPCGEDNEFLYGRGVCDAKGILAAQVAAADLLRRNGCRVALLFLVSEERDSAGAKVANQSPRGSKFLINGEPTDNRLALASKGSLRVDLFSEGRMAHSAYPELGDSAIHKLLDVLADIRALKLPQVTGIGDTTLNVGLISGGRAPNVVADAAEARLLFRLVGPSAVIRDAVVRVVNGRCKIVCPFDVPFIKMRAIDGFDTMVAKFTTDLPSLTNWGEPFLLGPGSIHVAHTSHERIAKQELLDSVDLYFRLGQALTKLT